MARGFLLSADQFTPIDFPGATATQPWGLNSAGDVVGEYTSAGVRHGFKLSEGQFATIDFPGATATTLTGINVQGEISAIYGRGGVGHGLLLSDGELTPLDVPGSTYTNATGLNERGDTVGRYVAVGGKGYGYLLREANLARLTSRDRPLPGAAAINKRGDIVGRYRTADGVFHGFLLVGFQSACVAYVPQVMTAAGGVAVTHSSDFTLVTAAKPASPGEVLTVFASGLGPTRPTVGPGQPFPAGPLAVVDSAVEVRMNGTAAEVLGAVGFPGAVDGYQVNFRVPTDITKGTASIQISAGMVVSPPVSIMIQ